MEEETILGKLGENNGKDNGKESKNLAIEMVGKKSKRRWNGGITESGRKIANTLNSPHLLMRENK